MPAPPGSDRGRFIVIAGPDGTGKSSLADALTAEVGKLRPVQRFHHRLRVLPASKESLELTNTPHAKPAYSTWKSRAKVLYLFLDELVGRVVRVERFVRSGGWVIVERGWWDLTIDPRRYRLSAGDRLAAWLGRLLPAPDATIVLNAPAAAISARKAELPPHELNRQLASWHRAAAGIPGAVIVDATQSPSAVLKVTMDVCGLGSIDAAASPTAAPWTGILLGQNRWSIPSGPARMVRSGLRIYHPMTLRGRVGWEAARLLAATPFMSAMRGKLAMEPIDAVRDFIPPGGAVAIFRGDVAARMVLLILDADGSEVGVAKIVQDDVGREKLALEAAGLRRLGPLLEAPLSSPRIIAVRDGLLVTEPVPWVPRSRPWHLPVELARAIGRFHARRPDNDSVDRPGHGDFAPWNVLRTRDGWSLIDWERASPASPPFADPLHYLIQAHALLGRPSRKELLAGIRGTGWVGEALQAYAEAAGLAAIDPREAMIDYLEETTAQINPSHSGENRSGEKRERLLRDLKAQTEPSKHGAAGAAPATPTRWHGSVAAAGRAGWGIADQALSSLTNFVLAVIVARSVSTEEFGAFTLAFGVYVICLTICRSVATDALVMRHSATDHADWLGATASATGAAIVFGFAASLISLAVGFGVGGVVGEALVVLAFGVVPLLLQDAWRFAFFAARRGGAAFLNDAAWAAGLAVGLAAIGIADQPSVSLLIAAWAAAAGGAALFGILQSGVLPRPDHALRWWRRHHDLAPRLAVEGIVLSATHYLTLLAVTVVAGLAAVGAVRAGEILMNALHVATFGIQLFATPEAVRIKRASSRRMVRFCVLVGAGLSLIALGWGAVLLTLPESIGGALLGDTWQMARSVILPLSIATAAIGIQISAVVGLRALALTNRSLSARIVSSGLGMIGGVTGAILAGAVGTAWGIAAGLLVGASVWWYHLLRGASTDLAANR